MSILGDDKSALAAFFNKHETPTAGVTFVKLKCRAWPSARRGFPTMSSSGSKRGSSSILRCRTDPEARLQGRTRRGSGRPQGLPSRRAASAVSLSPGLSAVLSVVLASALTMACGAPSSSPPRDASGGPQGSRHDVHSYANLTQVRVRHLDLDLEVLFDERILRGTATLTVDHVQPDADTIVLDTRDLTIRRVETSTPNTGTWPATFQVGSADPILGAPLTVFLPPDTTHVSGSVRDQPPLHRVCSGWAVPRPRGSSIPSCSRSPKRSTPAAGFRCRTALASG